MRRQLSGLAITYAILAASCGRLVRESTPEDNAVLAEALSHRGGEAGYTVVARNTMRDPVGGSREEIERSKAHLARELGMAHGSVGKLVDGFVAKNRRSARVSLASSPQSGYVVDRDGTYAKHFEASGDGWDGWHRDDPKARSLTTLSLPLRDESSGLAILCLGEQSGPRSGTGFLVAYRSEKGKLHEVGRVMLWVS